MDKGILTEVSPACWVCKQLHPITFRIKIRAINRLKCWKRQGANTMSLKNERGKENIEEGVREQQLTAQSLLPFNLRVIKIITSQSPSSIKEIDGRPSPASTRTHAYRKTKACFLKRVRDSKLSVPFRQVWSPSEMSSRTRARGHTWALTDTRMLKNTHINLISEDVIAARRCGETSASNYWLSSCSPGSRPIRRRAVAAQTLVNRNIGNQFTCKVCAETNMEVNIYWVKKNWQMSYGWSHAITWFQLVFSPLWSKSGIYTGGNRCIHDTFFFKCI